MAWRVPSILKIMLALLVTGAGLNSEALHSMSIACGVMFVTKNGEWKASGNCGIVGGLGVCGRDLWGEK
jgi:hypothetical protein